MARSRQVAKKPSESVVINGQTIGKDEKILIEKGWKFELVSAGKLKSMLPPIKNGPKSSKNIKMVSVKKEKPPRAKSPPIEVEERQQKSVILGRPRVRSATTDKPKKASVPRKSRSADAAKRNARSKSRNNTIDKHEIQSPYAMAPELKAAMKKLASTEAAKKREEERRRQLEDEETLKEAEKAWKAWLEKKNEEYKQEKKSSKGDKKSKKEEMRKHREAVMAFNDWLKSKRHQGRKERLLKQQEQIEYDELWYVRARKDCDRAFNSWLRKKHQEIERKKQNEIDARRQTRIAARRARRTNNLLRSVNDAQQMKYVEYYGYRF